MNRNTKLTKMLGSLNRFMAKNLKKLFIGLIVVLAPISTNAEDIYGSWSNSFDSASYGFRPLEAGGLLMVVSKNGLQDIYTGSIRFANFEVCSIDIEPFTACYSGVIRSQHSINMSLNSCASDSYSQCAGLPSIIELGRPQYHQLSGVFVRLDDFYFMINESAGVVEAQVINLEDGSAEIFAGTRYGNAISLQSNRNATAELKLDLWSNERIVAQVESCENCNLFVSYQLARGDSFELIRVTD
jgi:hypothetical protein